MSDTGERARALREAAEVAYAMRPSGGRAWTAEQAACYDALTNCGDAIASLIAAAPPPEAPRVPGTWPPKKGDVWTTRDGREWEFTGNRGYEGDTMERTTSTASHFDGYGHTGRAFRRVEFTDGTLTFVRSTPAEAPQGSEEACGLDCERGDCFGTCVLPPKHWHGTDTFEAGLCLCTAHRTVATPSPPPAVHPREPKEKP